MLDIRFVRENAELVEKKAQQKGYKINVAKLLKADERRRDLLKKVEDIRAQRNALTEQSKGGKPSDENLAKGKELRSRMDELESQLKPAESEHKDLLASVPNIFPDDTPLGGEEANREEKKWGDTNDKGHKVLDHLTWAENNGLIDFDRGAKVAGNKFYYLKAGLVEMELALAQFSLELVKKHGFWPMMVPHMVNTRILEGAGFSAKGEEKQVYKVEGEDLNLIATAEIPLTGFFADEIIPSEWLPSKMAGISPSYRLEAGAYGKHSRGLYRVHQFNKTELYIYCRPEESEEHHQKLLTVEEEICQKLELPYRVVRIAAGELGAPAYKKFDVEYWSPADKGYHELMSCSNVTDYQARRLNIRYKNEQGQTEYVHTLNATAAAYSRMLIAIIENNQTEGGKVSVPKALRPYMGGQLTIG
jgi:seryl-tRNA synthetase